MSNLIAGMHVVDIQPFVAHSAKRLAIHCDLGGGRGGAGQRVLAEEDDARRAGRLGRHLHLCHEFRSGRVPCREHEFTSAELSDASSYIKKKNAMTITAR